MRFARQPCSEGRVPFADLAFDVTTGPDSHSRREAKQSRLECQRDFRLQTSAISCSVRFLAHRVVVGAQSPVLLKVRMAWPQEASLRACMSTILSCLVEIRDFRRFCSCYALCRTYAPGIGNPATGGVASGRVLSAVLCFVRTDCLDSYGIQHAACLILFSAIGVLCSLGSPCRKASRLPCSRSLAQTS